MSARRWPKCWGLRHLRYWWKSWQLVEVRYTPAGDIIWTYQAADWATLVALWEGKA